MARSKASKNSYLNTGIKEEKRPSKKREKTEAGRLAAFIIDKIPEYFNFFEDRDINQVHLANAIVETCGRWIRYCPEIGWLVYKEDEGRWTEDNAEAAVQRVITHFGNLLFENAVSSNKGEVSFARSILSSSGIKSIKEILKCDTVIHAKQDKFDSDPELLNCMGDMYNLRTGAMRPCEPEDLFTKSTICKAKRLKRTDDGYEIPALSKRFEDFLGKITSKDGELRPDLAYFILSYFGYSLSGDCGAHFFVNFHGQGKNGKSVLLTLMMELFGNYAAPLSKDIVIENRFQSQFDLESMPGVRLGVLIDAPEGRLNMDLLKTIVDGGPMNGKRKHKKDFIFKSNCKVAVGSNPRLTLKDTGMAIRRRVRMVPFDYTVPEKDDVANLHRIILKEEAPDILSLLIWHAHQYYKNGEGPGAFPKCKVVDETSAEYMDSEDLVGRWMTERTEKTAEVSESATALYEDFGKWANEEGVRKVMSKNKFGEHLGLKIEKKRTETGVFYLDIKLKYPKTPPLAQAGPGSG